VLKRDQKLALFMMGAGALRYSTNPIVCAIDSGNAGKSVRDVMDVPRDCPIVGSVAEAAALGAEVFVLGIAPPGGLIPPEWRPAIDEAIELGLSLVNGLHERLGPRYSHLNPGQWVWDIRIEPEGLQPATGAARTLSARRILMIGTDMSIGKMTAGLELQRGCLRHGIKAEFVATGQIGMVITGRGVPLDAVRVDFAGGAIEREVMSYSEAEVIIVEGQGSLVHPGSTATLPLLRGSMPTDLVLCHRAGMTHLSKFPEIAIPPLKAFAQLYQDLAECVGTFPRPKLAGGCLITLHLDEPSAQAELARMEEELGIPWTDPVRFGVEGIVERLV
jgi:uncharacterized NAD-dependent epimerase/dehydratase family protein